jgi:hypothetical protein
MVKKLLTLMLVSGLAFSLSLPVAAQQSQSPEKTTNDRCEGTVLRSSKDNSTLTVRDNSGFDKTVQYEDSTKWVSQKHGSKTVNDIDASQVRDGDRVICRGSYDKKGIFHATSINKRLTPK